jgi:hypothetical protein
MFAETTFAVLIVPWLSNEQIRSVVVETGGKLPLNSISRAYSASRGDGLLTTLVSLPQLCAQNSTQRCGEI